ncbi:MAG: sporulation protein Cse60 [Bacilli bacterium]
MIKVKVIDENHEKDLETSINNFLYQIEAKIIDIKFSTSCALFSDEQVYCFSALIIYEVN